MRKIFMKGLLLLVPVFFMTFAAMSQSIVKGKIIDSETKEELVGATVMVKGTTEGIATSLDGSFELKTGAEGKQTLVFRSVGTKSCRKK